MLLASSPHDRSRAAGDPSNAGRHAKHASSSALHAGVRQAGISQVSVLTKAPAAEILGAAPVQLLDFLTGSMSNPHCQTLGGKAQNYPCSSLLQSVTEANSRVPYTKSQQLVSFYYGDSQSPEELKTKKS